MPVKLRATFNNDEEGSEKQKIAVSNFRPSELLSLQHDKRISEIDSFYIIVVVLLFLTISLGTLYSMIRFSMNETLFRTRIPAHSIPKFPINQLAFDLPTNPVNVSYFADKRNLFNKFFVKLSWAWTTIFYFGFYIIKQVVNFGSSSVSSSRKSSATNSVQPSDRSFRIEIKPLLRYAIATIFWILFTQWLFGPSISHRILTFSGAVCTPSALSSVPQSYSTIDITPCLPGYGAGSGPWSAQGVQIAKSNSFELESQSASQDVEKLYYYWTGGHDVSGHTFILIHSSLLLLSLIRPVLPRIFPSLALIFQSFDRTQQPFSKSLFYATLPVLALIGLWWWMLLMTSVYFHTPQEKFTGFIFGIMGWLSYAFLL